MNVQKSVCMFLFSSIDKQVNCLLLLPFMSSANKTILIISNRIPYPLKDGGALAMFTLLKGWYQIGYKVHLLAMNTSKHYISLNDLDVIFNKISSATYVNANNDIIIKAVLKNLLFSSKPEHAQRFYSLDFKNTLEGVVQKIKPDIIQFESIYLHEYFNICRDIAPQALIIQRIHNIEAQIWQRLSQQQSSFFKRIYYKNLAKRIAKYEHKVWCDVDALVPISKYDATFILQSGCKTPHCVIPLGFDTSKCVLPDWKLPLKFYHLGAMDWYANQEAITFMKEKVLHKIILKVPQFEFSFGGRNTPASFKNNLSPSFLCVGEIDNVDAFLDDKSILLVPLLSGSGLRVKIVEAMMYGKLVISTDIGIQGIDAIDTVHYLKANTPNEFAAAIEWCYSNTSKAQEIASNAQTFIKDNYDISKLMKKLDLFINNFL